MGAEEVDENASGNVLELANALRLAIYCRLKWLEFLILNYELMSKGESWSHLESLR